MAVESAMLVFNWTKSWTVYLMLPVFSFLETRDPVSYFVFIPTLTSAVLSTRQGINQAGKRINSFLDG